VKVRAACVAWCDGLIIAAFLQSGSAVLSAIPSHPGPAHFYKKDLQSGVLQPDAAQQAAVDQLQLLHEALCARWQERPSLMRRLRGAFRRERREPLQGLYLWGGVGRGKTYLMDLFVRALPGERKLRLHFNRFMLRIHQQLRALQGRKNPLQEVARELAAKVDVLCFDEFFVSDIGDAMLLGTLLEHLFAEGVTLVATSNIEPEGLYENGLQRQRFLPAIALLRRHTQVLNVDGGIDYRLQSLDRAATYYCPLDAAAEAGLWQLFGELTRGQEVSEGIVLEVQQRHLEARAVGGGIVWFDFSVLCGQGRGSADYVELACQYHTAFLSGVPALGESRDDETRRFITLVDEFYDHGVKLVLSAAVPLEGLYKGTQLAFAFERTKSRLLEMQTHEYLATAHRPD
jgi:cell division protein ZapE